MIKKHLFSIPKRLEHADESFYQGDHIDMIIGAELFYQHLCVGQHCLGDDLPILQRTRLGWFVSGVITNTNRIESVRCNFISHNNNIWNFPMMVTYSVNKYFIITPEARWEACCGAPPLISNLRSRSVTWQARRLFPVVRGIGVAGETHGRMAHTRTN